MSSNQIVINPLAAATAAPLKPKKIRRHWLRSYYQPFFYIALPLSLLTLIFTFFFRRFLPPQIPLFYTALQTQDQLAPREWIFILPALALGINFIHFGVIYFARHYDTTLIKVFEYFTIFIQALILAILLRIILIVI